MSEEKINYSVMKCCICNNKQCGEFITIEDKKYHLCCIENLQQEKQQLKDKLNCDLEWALKYDELYKENQQLKEDVKDLTNQKEMMFKNMQLNQLKVCKLAKILDEIREYIENNPLYNYKYDEEELFEIVTDEVATKDILQILDKVKE